MFFFRHPRPVTDGRAVAVQVVQQKVRADAELRVLTVPGNRPDQMDKASHLSVSAGLDGAKE